MSNLAKKGEANETTFSANVTCCHVSAIDASGTKLAYAETVNRQGISQDNVGETVMAACERLLAKLREGLEEYSFVITDEDIGQVIVSFSSNT